MCADKTADETAAIELYKLEYEKAAERYQEIYKSMWTMFSYLTAVSAGLVTFGAGRLHQALFIALVPLEFWFWTTYLPLERYGNRVAVRLGRIERSLNALVPDLEMKHFTELAADRARGHGIAGPVLRAWRGWIRQMTRKRAAAACRKTRDQGHRARFAIVFVFSCLHVLFAFQGYEYYRSEWQFLAAAPAATSAEPVTPGSPAPVEAAEPAGLSGLSLQQ